MAPTTLNASNHRGMGSTTLPEMLERLCFIPPTAAPWCFWAFFAVYKGTVFYWGLSCPRFLRLRRLQ